MAEDAKAKKEDKFAIKQKSTGNTFVPLSKEEIAQLIKNFEIREDDLERFLKKNKEGEKLKIKVKKEEYTIYKPNEYGKIANQYFKDTADKFVKSNEKMFKPMFDAFSKVDMPMLSSSYISLAILFTILSCPLGLLFALFFKLVMVPAVPWIIVILSPIVIPLLTFIAFYSYPSSLIGERDQKIHQDLPFALVHMSAIAGSGAHPMSIFELLAKSNEYPELKKEVKKVLNYVNLFGFNLSGSVKLVARTTPSPELRDLFDGMVTTIETGGDLNDYLKQKASSALDKYRLDKRKEVETMSTYSEVYTAILIAAPLLMVVSLAIINSISGGFGSLCIPIIASIAVYGVLPLLNILFMGFLHMQTSKF